VSVELPQEFDPQERETELEPEPEPEAPERGAAGDDMDERADAEGAERSLAGEGESFPLSSASRVLLAGMMHRFFGADGEQLGDADAEALLREQFGSDDDESASAASAQPDAERSASPPADAEEDEDKPAAAAPRRIKRARRRSRSSSGSPARRPATPPVDSGMPASDSAPAASLPSENAAAGEEPAAGAAGDSDEDRPTAIHRRKRVKAVLGDSDED
jgi:hypothetical protein